MAVVNPFICIRPEQSVAHRIAALPYDVYNREEAKREVLKEPLSFLRIDRAETNFGDEVDTYDPRVYIKAKELLQEMIEQGSYVIDDKKCYYVYELVMGGRTQTGLVACSSIDDYLNNVIKKHENTREEKEIDRINHVDVCNAQTGPIFLAYRSKKEIDNVIEETKREEPIYSFTSKDEIGHHIWRISDGEKIAILKDAFSKVTDIYIADGHHRAASAVNVGLKRREENPGYTGDEEFNFFLSVLFPHDQLMILPYNRAVMDLNGLTKEQFIGRIKENFDIFELGDLPYTPEEKASFGMFLDNSWYRLKAKEAISSIKDPVEVLDVSLLQKYILQPILGIEDPRIDTRIDFIGGIRGLKELEKRVSQDMRVAFSMYPTSIIELFEVSDAGRLMPPKSTWFEPKLRSGLFIHSLS